MRVADRGGRRRHVDAALPAENEYPGHEGARMQTFGRGYLQHQQIFAQGCDRHFRRRLHGRDRFARRPAVHQPPLRLRVDTIPVVGRTRLPEERLLGHVAPGGDSCPGAQGAFHPFDQRRDCGYSGQRAFHGRAAGIRTDHLGEYRRPDRFAAGGQPRHDGGGQALLRREPVFRLRDRGLYRRASGGSAPDFDRQVWR